MRAGTGSAVTSRLPLTSPKIDVDRGAVAAQVGVGGLLGALINPFAALAAFVDPGLAKDANCGALISSAR